VSETDLELQASAEEPRRWRSFVRRFGALAISETIASAIGLVAVLVTARRLGPESFGLVTLGLTIATWVAIVADSGTEILSVRNVAQEPGRFAALAERILGLRLTLAFVTGGVLAAVVFATVSHEHREVLAAFALLLPALALNPRWMVLGVRGARAIAIGNVVGRAVVLALTLLLVFSADDAVRVPFVQTAGFLVYALVVLGSLVPAFGVLRPRVDLSAWRETLREGLPLMVNSLARTSMNFVDVLAVGLLLGTSAAGVYGAAARPALFLTMTTWLFSVAFLSSYSATGGLAAARLFRRSARLGLAVGLVGAVTISVAAGALVPLLFGRRYADAGPVLAVLAWRLPLLALAALYSATLVTHGRQVALMHNNLVAAAVGVLGLAALVPPFGIDGAAVAMVAATLVVTVLTYRTAVRADLAPDLASTLLPRTRFRNELERVDRSVQTDARMNRAS
jgi:O-antigen/teichoic acid export membrane protein